MIKTLRVLIVEDSADDAALLVRELKRGGFTVESARVDTKDAFRAALGEGPWDIVIADYSLPNVSGLEALEIFKVTGLDRPFIMVSGAMGEEAVVTALKSGANGYIMKGNLLRLVPAVERELKDAEVRSSKRRAEEEIRLLNRLLQTIFEISQMIVKEADPDRLLSETCRILVEQGGFRMAWIGIADPDDGAIKPVAYAHSSELNIKDGPASGGAFPPIPPAGTATLTDGHVIFQDIAALETFAPWHKAALEMGYRSSASFPLRARDKVIGNINVYADNPNTFAEKMINLLDELAGDIGHALQALDEAAERKRAETELRESEERFRQIFEQDSDAQMLIEPWSCRVIDANPSAIAMYGFSREELLDKGCLFLPSDERQRFKHILSGNKAEGGFGIERVRTERKDGSTVYASAKARIIRLRNSNVVYFTLRDLTHVVRMEEESREIQARLIHANKMTSLGTLASGVAHEINNPNNFIMSNATLLKNSWQDASKVLAGYYRENGDFLLGGVPFSEMRSVIPELISGIADGARRIKNIVDNLKEFSRMDTSGMAAEFGVNRAVDAAVSILNIQINKYTDNFRVNCAPDLPSVKGSAQKIEQVVINLIINSLQSLPDRSRGVFVSTSHDRQTNSVVITVRDEGAGMSKDVLERITEPFFTTKSSEGGTGLGLSISYSIIKEHRGSLEFDSAPGAGTTAVIKLPAL